MENRDGVVLSFIIPIYNRQELIKTCIESICVLEKGSFEIIVVDDGSTDNTAKICKAYNLKDENFKYFRFDQNRGPGIARNIGMQQAKGKYLFFVDSDDRVLMPQMKLAYELLNQHDDVEIFLFDSGNEVENVVRKHSLENKILDQTDMLTYFPMAFSYPAWRFIFRKTFILDNNIRFASCFFGEDNVFVTAAMLEAKRLLLVPTKIYKYVRMTEDSITTVQNPENILKGIEYNLEFSNDWHARKQTTEVQEQAFANLLEVYKGYALSQWGFCGDVNSHPLACQLFHNTWQEYTDKLKRITDYSSVPIYLLPASNRSISAATNLQRLGTNIAGILDNNADESNPGVHRAKKAGFSVYSLNEPTSYRNGKLLVCAHGRVREEIEKQLILYGLIKEKDFI